MRRAATIAAAVATTAHAVITVDASRRGPFSSSLLQRSEEADAAVAVASNSARLSAVRTTTAAIAIDPLFLTLCFHVPSSLPVCISFSSRPSSTVGVLFDARRHAAMQSSRKCRVKVLTKYQWSEKRW